MQKEFITPNQQLRNKHLPCQPSRRDETYLDYLALLKSHGLEVNSKCFPSYFKLKNGLEYPGIATGEQMGPHQIMAKCPKNLIFTSFIASQRPQLQEVFKENFYHIGWSWQDRIMCTYLLYIYGKKQTDNIWYQMVLHLSKDIDIVGFWSQQDLDKFKDLTMKSAAQLDNQSFEEQWQQVRKIQEKYQILQNPQFTKQNYKWIFTHLISRSFGKSIQFTAMVPFCQFFNHHAVDGHYDALNKQGKSVIPSRKEQNKNAQGQQQAVRLDKNQQESQVKSITTQGSYLSEQYIQVGQFAYDQLEFKPFSWSCKEHLDLSQKQRKEIIQLKETILKFIQTSLKWDDFTILFVPFLIQRCKLIETEYRAGRKNYQKAHQQLSNIKESAQLYRDYVVSAYTKWRGKDFKYLASKQKAKQEQKQKDQNTQNDQNKQVKQYVEFPTTLTKQYQQLIICTGRRDHYLPNNQVYFCYGRNSNRTLLLRYGFAIEGNKYQHVWLSFDIVNTLLSFPDTLSKLEQKQLSLRRKFKVKYNRLNMELILFFRLNSWSYCGKGSVEEIWKIKDYGKEIAILLQIKDQLQFKLKQYEGPYDLTDPKLSYHQYFITVYHQQKQIILNQQIGYAVKLVQFLKSLEKGVSTQQAKEQFSPQEKFIFRHYFAEF